MLRKLTTCTWLLIVAVMLSASMCGKNETNNITTNNVSIHISGVECFTLILPDFSEVRADRVTVTGSSTVSIGGKSYTVSTDCHADPITTTNPKPA